MYFGSSGEVWALPKAAGLPKRPSRQAKCIFKKYIKAEMVIFMIEKIL